ncbi:hypothetical protein INR49_007085, partial [Caranx melampygus]
MLQLPAVRRRNRIRATGTGTGTRTRTDLLSADVERLGLDVLSAGHTCPLLTHLKTPAGGSRTSSNVGRRRVLVFRVNWVEVLTPIIFS